MAYSKKEHWFILDDGKKRQYCKVADCDYEEAVEAIKQTEFEIAKYLTHPAEIQMAKNMLFGS